MGSATPKQGTSAELVVDATIGGFPAFHINPTELDELIEMHGIGATIRRAVVCPCKRPESGRARIGCPHCRGLGYAYPDDLTFDIIAFVLSRGPRREIIHAGEIVTGQAWCSFPSGYIPAAGDQILPVGEFHVVQEVIHRAFQPVDGGAVYNRAPMPEERPPRPRAPTADRLLYDTIEAVERVAWIESEGSRSHLIVGGASDFIIEGNEIRWRAGRGPRPGAGVSVRYKAPAAYMLHAGEPIFRAEGGQALPYRAQAIRLDRWGVPDLR